MCRYIPQGDIRFGCGVCLRRVRTAAASCRGRNRGSRTAPGRRALETSASRTTSSASRSRIASTSRRTSCLPAASRARAHAQLLIGLAEGTPLYAYSCAPLGLRLMPPDASETWLMTAADVRRQAMRAKACMQGCIAPPLQYSEVLTGRHTPSITIVTVSRSSWPEKRAMHMPPAAS